MVMQVMDWFREKHFSLRDQHRHSPEKLAARLAGRTVSRTWVDGLRNHFWFAAC